MTQEYNHDLLILHPEVVDSQRIIDGFINDFALLGAAQPHIIPLVFHVVQTPGMPEITTEQINAQVDALNRDFSGMDHRVYELSDYATPFIQRAVIPSISFCHATISDTLAVFRVESSNSAWAVGNKMQFEEYGGSSAYMPESHLNIWVCDLVDSVSGYAQLPGGLPQTDGIIIDYSFFGISNEPGNPYGEGKTLSHLVGSYLGLYELWNVFCPCFDDKVFDTPIHNEPNTGSELANRHVSTCIGNDIEMTMNFMDNTNDAYMYMFTYGQMMRMQAVLAIGGARHSLVVDSATCVDKYSFAKERMESLTRNSQTFDSVFIEVFPNPASNNINIVVHAPEEGFIEMRILDVSARPVWQVNEKIEKSERNYFVTSENWPKGVYLVFLRINKYFMMKRIVIN